MFVKVERLIDGENDDLYAEEVLVNSDNITFISLEDDDEDETNEDKALLMNFVDLEKEAFFLQDSAAELKAKIPSLKELHAEYEDDKTGLKTVEPVLVNPKAVISVEESDDFENMCVVYFVGGDNTEVTGTLDSVLAALS